MKEWRKQPPKVTDLIRELTALGVNAVAEAEHVGGREQSYYDALPVRVELMLGKGKAAMYEVAGVRLDGSHQSVIITIRL